MKNTNSWIDNLPDDDVQVGMLKYLDSNGPGTITVGGLAENFPDIGKSMGVKTLQKMVRYGQVNVEKDGKVFLTGFGRRVAAGKK